MTKKRLESYRQLYNRLQAAGFGPDEVDALLRIEQTLHRWAERECNGEIERDEEGRPFASHAAWGGKHLAYRIPDREAGAQRRLAAIMKGHPEYVAYEQGDPRGCALYLVKRADLSEGVAYLDRSYHRGIAVCI